jgi:hypothetical protein
MYPPKGRADFLKLGDWNANCSMCGAKRKASELVQNWQGQWRCPKHNEARHPQDFVRAVPDVETPDWVQHDGVSYVGPGSTLCTLAGQQAFAGQGTAGCMIPGSNLYTGP